MNYHGPAYTKYAANHTGVVLAACCDINKTKAVEFRDRFGFARHYTDFVAMLDAEHPDAVCLNVPVSLTCELARQYKRARQSVEIAQYIRERKREYRR